MNYNLLKLDLNYSIVGSFFQAATICSSDISSSINSEEYDYQGFEYEPTAITKVCDHAAAMISKIENHLGSAAVSSSLSRDYRNAIKCLKTEKNANREHIDNLTIYMLASDWETVIDSITEMYNENKLKKQDELPESSYIPDYGKMLVMEGDRALFQEENINKAIKEYSAAIYSWRSKYAGKTNNFSLTVGEKEKIKYYIQLFAAINDGQRLTINTSFLENNEKQIIEKYKKIISKNNLHEQITDDIEELAQIINDILNLIYSHFPLPNYPGFKSSDLNTLRTIKVIIPKLVQLGLLDEVKSLSDESPVTIKQLSPFILNKVKYLAASDMKWIWYAFMSIKSKNDKLHLLTAIAKVQDDIRQIKKVLLIKDNIPELAYYTSWKTLSYMLPGKKDEPEKKTDSKEPNSSDEKKDSDDHVGKFSIMHLSYMNDPMEGIVIRNYLLGDSNQVDRKQENHPYVFVKCFTQSLDYLPMWKTYGDDAAGCCIVVDWKETIKQNAGENIPLYRICYMSKKNGAYTFQKVDNHSDLHVVGELLSNLKVDMESLKSIEEDTNASETLLGSIAYLFKDSSYSYEKEARILYSFNEYNDQIQETDQEPAKLFVYSDYRVVIKELILGPKFQDVYLWSPLIKMKLEKMNEIVLKTNTTKLSLSDINYR